MGVLAMGYLFHGSRFLHEELMPGFRRSGQLQKWDGTESNKFLYASTNPSEAAVQGLFSLIGEMLDVKVFHCSAFTEAGFTVTVELYPHEDADKTALLGHIQHVGAQAWLRSLTVYLYQIRHEPEDHWVQVLNETNGLGETEWKTNRTVSAAIEKVKGLNMGEFFQQCDGRLEIIPAKVKTPAYAGW